MAEITVSLPDGEKIQLSDKSTFADAVAELLSNKQRKQTIAAGAGEALAKTGEQRHQNRRYKVHGLSPGACAVVQPHASVGKPLFVSSRAAPTGDENRETLD